MRATAVVLALPLLLSGCAVQEALMPVQRSGIAADPAALALDWSTPAMQPSWIPADATRIRWVARTTGGADAAPAAIRLRSSAALPASCRDDDAAGVAITAAWAPAHPAGAVRVCGNWAVTEVPGGYYGWTPATSPG